MRPLARVTVRFRSGRHLRFWVPVWPALIRRVALRLQYSVHFAVRGVATDTTDLFGDLDYLDERLTECAPILEHFGHTRAAAAAKAGLLAAHVGRSEEALTALREAEACLSRISKRDFAKEQAALSGIV